MDDHTQRLAAEKPHAAKARMTDDPPVALAKEAIKLLEARIAKEFGLRVVMGEELEFAVDGKMPKELVAGDAHFVKERFGGSHTPSAARTEHKDPAVPDSGTATYGYREAYAGSWEKYEMVLSHKPVKRDGSPREMHGLDWARLIEAWRFQLHHPKPGYMPRAPEDARFAETLQGRKAAAHWQQFVRHPLVQISTKASILEEELTCGLHLNASLVDVATGAPVVTEEQMGHAPIFSACSAGIREMFDHALYLLGRDRATQERWSLWDTHASMQKGRATIDSNTYAEHVKEKDDAECVENRLPAISSNPYYAVMLELAGIYRGLQLYYAHPEPSHEVFAHVLEHASPVDKGAAKPVELRRQFERSILLREMLNGLRGGLGDEFYRAIDKKPPGAERSAVAKRHNVRGEHAGQVPLWGGWCAHFQEPFKRILGRG